MGDRKYGICLQPCTIQLIPERMNNTGFLSAGTLFLIERRKNFSEVLIKRLLNDSRTRLNYENETYICKTDYFKEIDYKLFLLLLAVKPEKRCNLTHDEHLLTFVLHIHLNQRVSIPKTSFRGRQNDLDCVVRYIGPVPEIGLGVFFGFILINPMDSIEIHGTLAQKYLRCENSKGFIRSVDVFYRGSQPNYNNQLKTYPNVSSIDPYGSMESLSSERSFGNANNRRQNRNNSNSRNRNKGLPVYNADNPISSASGMDLISFEPVTPNYIQPSKKLEPPRPVNIYNSASNMRVTNNVQPLYQLVTPLEYQLPKPEVKLQFTPVPNKVVADIINKSTQNVNRDNLRQKYELLKKEFDNLKNSKNIASKENDGLNVNQAAAIPNQKLVAPQRKYKCTLKSCPLKTPQRRETDYRWDGNTEFYTSSIHQVKCGDCQELKLKCYTSKLYGANREFNAFIAVLKESGFNVSFPENKYLAVTDQDKTKVIDLDKKREPYYACTIRANITINKNRFKTLCKKCNSAVDVSQGISLAACHHVFCNNCLSSHIKSSQTPVMKCPIAKCSHKLKENEIHAYMTEPEFQVYLQSLHAADNLFYCTNKSCNGCIPINRTNRDKIVLLYCPECGQFNCIDCKTIHTGITCDEFQRKNNFQNLPTIPAANNNMGAFTKNIIFKCKVDNCRGYLVIQPNDTKNLIPCPECSTINCRACQDIHKNLTCREFQSEKCGVGRRDFKTLEYNDDEWVCSNCTFIHKEKVNRCQMCLNQRVAKQIQLDDFLVFDDVIEYSGSEDNDDIESIISSEGNQYEKLLELEDTDIIRNIAKFECLICFNEIDVGKGVKLHDCLHEFCEDCLTNLIKSSDQAPVTCPLRENDFICEGTLQHREMKYLVDDDVYEQFLYRSLLQAQKDLKNCFQCKSPDCRGMWEFDENVEAYECLLCNQVNCHQCNAVHGNMSCRAYQQKVYDDTNPEALATRLMYDEMFANGKALRCPQCQIVIARDEGCSWVVCALCKTEICWATRGPRWGPKGNGDTSGGCKCDFKNGKPCHPNCEYCH